MKYMLIVPVFLLILPVLAGNVVPNMGTAEAQETWPAVFDPFEVLTLNLQLNVSDWQTVLNDTTYDIEVPAWFWTGEESPIFVSVRRKSGDPIQIGPGPPKVSLKIDINEYIDGQKWRDLTKISLENGDDSDVVREGIAWNLHRMASGPEGYGYEAGFAAWVRVVVNDEYVGFYASVEQRNKQFLRNRDLYTLGESWLYKISDMNGMTIEVGEPDSPTVEALCYSPFHSDPTCPTPEPEVLATELPTYVNMQGMLSMAAVEAFVAAGDALFTHTKNAFFADFLNGPTRMYVPWDLDSVLSDASHDIYGGTDAAAGDGETGRPPGPTVYQTIILGNPTFRAQFDQIMLALLGGPLSGADLVEFVDQVEAAISVPLAEDPNNQIEGSIPEFFNGVRAWLLERIDNVLAQIGVACTDNDGDGVYVEGGDCGEVYCDYNDSAVYPGRDEDCANGIDDNCDGLVDGDDPGCLCSDVDGDGYGDPAGPMCTHPEEDCDDNDPDVNPGAEEGPEGDPTCSDLVDNDCDGLVDGDEPDCATCWDDDGDGYEDEACGGDDCDDMNPDVNPGTLETDSVGNCEDGIDNDCDGLADAADAGCSEGCFIQNVM